MAKLSAAELAKREDVIMKMKKNKRGLVKRYGPDAEKVMYGRATNIAKKVTETQMEQLNLKELIRAALMQEKAGFSKEFDSDPALKGGQKNLPDGLQKSIIAKAKPANEDLSKMALYNPTSPEAFKSFADKVEIDLSKNPDTTDKLASIVSQILDAFPALMKQIQVVSPDIFKDKKSLDYANALAKPLKELNILLKDLKQSAIKEDLDLGHEDNEPHMIKSELYRIGKYAMELYQMVDQFEGEGEVDFPAWWQAKITTAKNMVSSAKHYLEFELKEPEIDAMVGVATGEDIIPNIPSEPLEDEIEEGNLGHNELASLEPEGRFWIVTYRTMDGKKEKIFTDEDEARAFMGTVSEGLPKGYFKKATAELDESFEKLVGKLKKGGKSEKAAKAIAGAVASYKAKGGGKGPTAKQKARG